MNYMIKRGDKEYGPYTLAALQQYVAQGNISPTDLARSEGMTEWMPVSTIIGNVPVSTAVSATAGAAAFGAIVTPASSAEPAPPSLHWGVVLLLVAITFGVFGIVWLFVEANWVRKINPKSKAPLFALAYLGSIVGEFFLTGDLAVMGAVLRLVGVVLYLVAVFQMRSDIEDYYARLNPVGLQLGAAMTFFFNVIYFQYHFPEIREAQQNPVRTSGPLAAIATI
jgi:uncharacterized membrane protein